MKALRKIKNLILSFIQLIKTIFVFAWNDLKKRYAGSIGGFLWAYIQPLVSILVFWFVFQVGLKNADVGDTKFILWFVPAYIAWSYANDSIIQSSNVLYEYSFLVKKVKFRTWLLPLIKIADAFIIHVFFIVFVFVLNLIYKVPFNPMWFQVFYYSFALSVMLVGICWFVSAITVFWKDFGQIVNVVLQIGFWMAPVFWNPETMNENVVKILKFNPFFYIVQGYRECFVGNVGFWNHQYLTIGFWCFTGFIFVAGYFIFKRLSKHYSDLL